MQIVALFNRIEDECMVNYNFEKAMTVEKFESSFPNIKVTPKKMVRIDGQIYARLVNIEY